MKKVAVVYWSMTGNTEAMANAVCDGAKEAGAEVSLFSASEFDAGMVGDYDAIGFGCPAMGDETLEEDEFEPMFSACEEKLAGKSVVLFGSYDWGVGDWMESWKERTSGDGAVLAAEPVIANLEPVDEAIAACEALGKALAG